MRRYGFILLPGFSLLSLAAALDVLAASNQILGRSAYHSLLLDAEEPAAGAAAGSPGATSGQVSASCGASLATRPFGLWARPAASTSAATAARPDLPALDGVFLVADGPCLPGDDHAHRLAPWLHGLDRQGLLLGGIGTGAAWLAEAGLLRGHRATVHWPQISPLAERHAEVLVSQQLFEIDRQRLSCAGHQASRDLFIAWVAQQQGERLAHELAAWFGLERLRGRDERQRVPLAARLAADTGGGSAKLAEALALMEANLAEPLPTEDIARLVGVSRRQLERLFKQHLDALPSRWYLSLRLQRAQRLLRQTHQSVLQIGLACGFASGPHFSNAYRAHFGHTPRDERSLRLAARRQASDDAAAAGPAPDIPTADFRPARGDPNP